MLRFRDKIWPWSQKSCAILLNFGEVQFSEEFPEGNLWGLARSPDLISVDFFLWVYLKNKVCRDKIEDLKQRISSETINSVQKEFAERLAHCQAAEGR